jgi:hypothetical protein
MVITPEQFNDLVLRVARSSAVIKMVCGVSNNATWLLVRYAHDQAKKSRRYNGKVKKLFKQALEEFHHYEHNLIYARENRMFHLDDLEPSVRRKYGDITDREYYDFWASTGSQAYQQSKPLITSLWNKYRVSLVKHDVKDAEHVAWVMTAQAAIDLSLAMYESAMKECETGMNLHRKLLDGIFGQFSLKTVSKDWMRALMLLAPETNNYQLDSTEERNIEFGLEQLMEAWLNPELLYSSASGAVDEYDEIFATKGFVKKVQREIAEVRAETLKELENEL